MNLLQETLEAIAESGHASADIVFIGSPVSGHACSWDEFTVLADFDYDDGYGAQIVSSDLVIVFADCGHLRRTEYDGSEGWEYIAPFKAPESPKMISKLTGGTWSTLADHNP
ncbi:hypothetical protein RT21_19945 [Pseudomonas sp. 10B238]|uniref:hypothetical protein n=1 Tax=Pseudomonas sp. 10B238 TaxID=1586417 RepID=UPI000618165E|nr:hypothetical protein [Pseudomonas sp. 10B238]KJJ61513.1 hypothetical protein RT21_19945 [Pseudomonas sp. 10B238]